MTTAKIIYTKTDEAPALATQSLFPIIKAFTRNAGVDVAISDISLAGRIIAQFPDYLTDEQRIDDALAQLSELVLQAEANIIKLPNISASIPQVKVAITELQQKGYALPDYPEQPENEQQQEIKNRYDSVKGSAVNPVLREGNSDRRVPSAVKNYVRKDPHKIDPWRAECRSHVASMTDNDFFASEQSVTIQSNGHARIELQGEDGRVTVLKASIPLLAGEIIDAAAMNIKALRQFIAAEIADAKKQGVLFSLHLKATMMKVSDPIIFGHVVSVFYQDVLTKHRDLFEEIGIDANNGLGDIYAKINDLPPAKQAEIKADIEAVYTTRPDLAMVNSEKGITNLHVPSDVIIDASIPAMLRSSGQMWNKDGEQQDTKAVIPDRCYAGIYQKVIDFCSEHGAFDPAKMGSVANVGLMAQKAEEYGSHDKTFECPASGIIRVVNESGTILLEHTVEQGDIWRMCQTKDEPIQDWVKLAVNRTRTTNTPAVFWLDNKRAHDAQLIVKVKRYLAEHTISNLDIRILPPVEAMQFCLARCKNGQDTIAVTGNVLRDYLTDLFPILEVGTSAKMLSIVPLLSGGCLFETGAGGSAPKLVQQFERSNHLRWDSLGEFLALAASLEHLANTSNNDKAQILAATLDKATGKWLANNKSPSAKIGELDNRGSHFYLALYWAQALAEQNEDRALQSHFAQLAKVLAENEQTIITELNAVQGQAVNVDGYYCADEALLTEVMRPSATFNALIDKQA